MDIFETAVVLVPEPETRNELNEWYIYTAPSTLILSSPRTRPAPSPSNPCPSLRYTALNATFIAIFTVEFLTRLLTCPSKLKFGTSLMNWLDLSAILPFYIGWLIYLVEAEVGARPKDGSPDVHAVPTTVPTTPSPSPSRFHPHPASPSSLHPSQVRLLRLGRVLRIFKFARHSTSVRMFTHAVTTAGEALVVLILFLTITTLFFGTLVYYAESEFDRRGGIRTDSCGAPCFRSIPAACWSVPTPACAPYRIAYHPRLCSV